MRRSGRAIAAVVDGGLAGAGVVDADVGVLEAGDDDGGEVHVVLDEQDVGGAVAGVEDAGELGEQEMLVERLLDPALGGGGDAAAVGGDVAGLRGLWVRARRG